MFETVIGVEVHFELATATKLYCSCPNIFGAVPNTCCCPVCAGMPGALPVLNRRAVEYAVMSGLALGCNINSPTAFDRKNYFYPDMPNGYQISQLYTPICTDGKIAFSLNGEQRNVRIREIHLEDDAGKLIHNGNDTKVDYNRAGVPLIEVVTQPDMRSAEEVAAFLEELRLIIGYIGVSDCKMQEGSMRVDVNLSVRREGEPLGTRTEMKNLNSLKAVMHAVRCESARQISVIESGGSVEQQTRRFDDVRGVSTVMRDKENADDYRYFPEPNIPPIEITEDIISSAEKLLPELPDSRRKRYVSDSSLSSADAQVLTADRSIADFFERTVAICGDAREAANRITGDIMREMNERGCGLSDAAVTPEKLARIIVLCSSGVINRSASRELINAAFADDIDIDAYIAQHELAQITDSDIIRDAVRQVIDDNPRPVADFRSGKSKAFGNIVGMAMKKLNGRADPALVNKCVDNMLK